MYKVGDTVHADFSRYGRVTVRQGTVVKVTPTGRINVDFGDAYADGKVIPYQFDPKGMEIGRDKWHRAHIIDEEVYQRLSARQKQQEALAAVGQHVRSTSITNKVSLDAFMEKLLPLVAAVGDDQ